MDEDQIKIDNERKKIKNANVGEEYDEFDLLNTNEKET